MLETVVSVLGMGISWLDRARSISPEVVADDSGLTVTLRNSHVTFQVLAEVERCSIDGAPLLAPHKYFEPRTCDLGGENTQPATISLTRFLGSGAFKQHLKGRVLQVAKKERFLSQQEVYIELLVTVTRLRVGGKPFYRLKKRERYKATAVSIWLVQKDVTEYTEKDFNIEMGPIRLVRK